MIPIYFDHALIQVTLTNGTVFYIDRAMVGGSDHISFELPPTLILSNQPMSEAQRQYLENLSNFYINMSGGGF